MTTEMKLERMVVVQPYGEYVMPVSKMPLLMEALSHMIRVDQDYNTKKWREPASSNMYIKYLCTAEAAALLFDTGIMSVVDVDVEAK